MNTSYGLDIGTSTVKVVALSGKGNEISLRSCLAVQSPLKGMVSESASDLDTMSQTLRSLISSARISSSSANIALADNQVFTKVIDMPKLSEKELASAIYWEAEQYIPAPLPTVTIDWRILRQGGDGKMQVLLVGAPTDLIKKYQNVCELAGITVASIETETLAIIRAVAANEATLTRVIINIGALSTSLAIVQAGTIVFTYTISLGGIAINRAIASEFGFTPQQAEEYKRTYGLANENFGGKIGKAIEPILSAIAVEVKKALAFYNEKYKNEMPVTQILLSGGTAKLPGIDLFFVKNVGIETAIANPWKLLNIQGVPKEVVDSGPDYAIAVGLALKENE